MPGRMLAASLAAGLVASLAVTACAAPRRDVDDERTETATIREIALAGGTGSVTVRPGSGTTTVIRRHVRYQRHERPGRHDRVEGDVLRVNTACGMNCATNYEISVPSAVKISGRTGEGAVDLTSVGAVNLEVLGGPLTVRGADGPVNVMAGYGVVEVFDAKGNVTVRGGSRGIRVHRAGGMVTAETHSGQVEVRDAGGDQVSLRTSTGGIGVFLNRPQSVHAASDNGAIKVTVPAGAPFDVRATTRRGDVRIEVPVTDGAPSLLELHTRNSEIVVVEAPKT